MLVDLLATGGRRGGGGGGPGRLGGTGPGSWSAAPHDASTILSSPRQVVRMDCSGRGLQGLFAYSALLDGGYTLTRQSTELF